MTDLVRVERFEELAPGGATAILELVELFLSQMREQMAHLRDAVARGAADDIELIAHRCAGTTAVCGAESLSQTFAALEQLAKQRSLADAERHLAVATAAFADVEDALTKYAAGLSD